MCERKKRKKRGGGRKIACPHAWPVHWSKYKQEYVKRKKKGAGKGSCPKPTKSVGIWVGARRDRAEQRIGVPCQRVGQILYDIITPLEVPPQYQETANTEVERLICTCSSLHH